MSKKKEKELNIDEGTFCLLFECMLMRNALLADIMKGVNMFIRSPGDTELHPVTRAAIRTHQSIAPTAATTFRSLALDILTTNRDNILCPYHQEMDKRHQVWDGAPDAKYKINGVPMPRLVADTKKEARTKPSMERLKQGFLHCGCPTDAALWDFYFWKSLTLSAMVNGEEVTESVPRWTPRERAFILEIFRKYTFLTIDDLYSGNRAPDLHEEMMLVEQTKRILNRVNKLRLKRGLRDSEKVVLKDPLDRKGDGQASDDGSDSEGSLWGGIVD